MSEKCPFCSSDVTGNNCPSCGTLPTTTSIVNPPGWTHRHVAIEAQADADRELGRLVRKLSDENSVGVCVRSNRIFVPRMNGPQWEADTLDEAARAAWEGMK